MKALSQSVERELKFIKNIIKVGQRSKSRSPGINCWYVWKGIITSNTYVKYESPKSKCRKRSEIHSKYYKSRSNVKVKVIRYKLLVCVQAIHMSNMKALSQSVETELKFLKNIIKVGQRSKSRSPGINCWYVWKGLVSSNTYVKYESPKSKGRKRISIKEIKNLNIKP
jgi:hypothetical protein